VIPFLISASVFCMSLSSNHVYEITNSMCWLSKYFVMETIVLPVVLICTMNFLIIGLIIHSRCSIESELFQKGFKNRYRLSASRINLFTLLTCALFSGNLGSFNLTKYKLDLNNFYFRNFMDSAAVCFHRRDKKK